MITKYLSSGISVIPVKPDKLPCIDWKAYQSRIATIAEAEYWKLPIAAVCGKVSGGLVCIDFDDKGSRFKGWYNIVKQSIPDVAKSICFQKTPSGGYHAIFRSDLTIRNTKLAEKADRSVLIETRGEGGYFLVNPSDGYEAKAGDFLNPPKLSDENTNELLDIARSFNEHHEENNIPDHIQKPILRYGKSPFDDYDESNTPIADLESEGWKVVSEKGDKVVLRRPGKERGISATWNHIPNRFYVFTSSTAFDPQKIYKPSAVYAILKHNGDYIAAAKALSQAGYGERKKEEPVDVDMVPAAQTIKISDFRQRIYDFYSRPMLRGLSIGFPKFDKLLRVDTGYLNVVVGIPSHGKSAFVDMWSMFLAKKHGWRFVVFSPENYPLEIHYHKLAELYHWRGMFGAERYVVDEAIDFIDRHYVFVDATEEDISLDSILNVTRETENIQGLIIDPWNEIEMSHTKEENASDFIGKCLRKMRKFARKFNIAIFLVVHPTKMHHYKDSETYPIPTLYDCSGSANFYNKADNGISVYRDFDNNITTIYVQKVKYRNYGELGESSFRFVGQCGGYEEIQ